MSHRDPKTTALQIFIDHYIVPLCMFQNARYLDCNFAKTSSGRSEYHQIPLWIPPGFCHIPHLHPLKRFDSTHMLHPMCLNVALYLPDHFCNLQAVRTAVFSVRGPYAPRIWLVRRKIPFSYYHCAQHGLSYYIWVKSVYVCVSKPHAAIFFNIDTQTSFCT